MSGIYIKGMNMPNKKGGTVLIIYPHGVAVAMDGDMYKSVPVPEHGRLIDADKLLARVTDYYGTSYTIDMICEAPTIIPAEEGE